MTWRFVDEDLDEVDLGGIVSWTPPASLRRVASYRLDLATETERSQIGAERVTKRT